MQTHIHKKGGKRISVFFQDLGLFLFSSELSFLTFLNYFQFLSRFGSVMTLWVRDSEGGGRVPMTPYVTA